MRHKTLVGVGLIVAGVVFFACYAIASFDPGSFDAGPTHMLGGRMRSLLPICGAAALAAGFGLTILDDRRTTGATAR